MVQYAHLLYLKSHQNFMPVVNRTLQLAIEKEDLCIGAQIEKKYAIVHITIEQKRYNHPFNIIKNIRE